MVDARCGLSCQEKNGVNDILVSGCDAEMKSRLSEAVNSLRAEKRTTSADVAYDIVLIAGRQTSKAFH